MPTETEANPAVTVTTTTKKIPIHLDLDQKARRTVNERNRGAVLHNATFEALVWAASKLVDEGILVGEAREGKLHIRTDVRTLRRIADSWLARITISRERAEWSVGLLEGILTFLREIAPTADLSAGEIALHRADIRLEEHLWGTDFRCVMEVAEKGILDAEAQVFETLGDEVGWQCCERGNLPPGIFKTEAIARIRQASEAGGLEGIHQLLFLKEGLKVVWNPAKAVAVKSNTPATGTVGTVTEDKKVARVISCGPQRQR